jgi:hypothetical protein
VRRDENRIAMEFAENDIVTEAIVQDLMFYQKRGRKQQLQKEQACYFAGTAPDPVSS